MLCLACAVPSGTGPLCSACAQSLRLAPSRLAGSVLVQPVFNHSGAAASLVHNLKYRRSEKAGRFLALYMAERLPTTATSLVPVPRVLSRRIAYGIDQTATLAAVISDVSGLPVVDALAPPLWNRRSAGKDRSHRRIPRFRLRTEPVAGCVLIDDVCTTGTTISGAAMVLNVELSSLVATSASSMRLGAAFAAPRR